MHTVAPKLSRVVGLVSIVLVSFVFTACELFELSPFPGYLGYVREFVGENISLNSEQFNYHLATMPLGNEVTSNAQHIALIEFADTDQTSTLLFFDTDFTPISTVPLIAAPASAQHFGSSTWVLSSTGTLDTFSYIIGNVILELPTPTTPPTMLTSDNISTLTLRQHALGDLFGAQLGADATPVYVLFDLQESGDEWQLVTTSFDDIALSNNVGEVETATGVQVNEEFIIEGVSQRLDDSMNPIGAWLDIFYEGQLWRFGVESTLDGSNIFNQLDLLVKIDRYQKGTLTYLDIRDGAEIVIQRSDGYYQRFLGTSERERAPYQLPKPDNHSNRVRPVFPITDSAGATATDYYILDEGSDKIARVERWW